MGLDMYLTKRVYVKNWDHMPPEKRHAVSVTKGGKNISAFPPCEAVFEAGYWRKANHIHAWFVKNVQAGNDDCGNYEVSLEQLCELLGICQQVMALAESTDSDHVSALEQSAKNLLPTQEGLFFGATDYGEYYLEDTKRTIGILKACLAEGAEDGHYCYQSSW